MLKETIGIHHIILLADRFLSIVSLSYYLLTTTPFPSFNIPSRSMAPWAYVRPSRLPLVPFMSASQASVFLHHNISLYSIIFIKLSVTGRPQCREIYRGVLADLFPSGRNVCPPGLSASRGSASWPLSSR